MKLEGKCCSVHWFRWDSDFQNLMCNRCERRETVARLVSGSWPPYYIITQKQGMFITQDTHHEEREKMESHLRIQGSESTILFKCLMSIKYIVEQQQSIFFDARFFKELVSESVFLIKILNPWLLTLILLVDINPYFTLLLFWATLRGGTSLNLRHLMLLHLTKKATISQEKVHIVLLCPRREGKKLQNQELDATTTICTQLFAPIFTSLHPGLRIKQ